jgi:hypothetical protein
MIATMLDERGPFKSNEFVANASKQMLDELFRWAQALKPMRD